MANENLPPRIHVLAKPTGATCNLNCSYCFFLNKELLYPGSSFRMSDAVLENYIRQLIESHHANKVTVAWQDGEPTLMGLDFYRRAIEYQNKYQRPGMTFENTLLNAAFASLLSCFRSFRPSQGNFSVVNAAPTNVGNALNQDSWRDDQRPTP